MDELIARLEAATGPDPHLDAEIEAAVKGGEPAYRTASRHQFGPSVVLNHGAGNPWDGWESAPSFTGLVDAAITLIPAGKWWIVGPGKTRHDEPLYGAAIYAPVVGEPQIIASGEHETSAPIALCIAALRART